LEKVKKWKVYQIKFVVLKAQANQRRSTQIQRFRNNSIQRLEQIREDNTG